MNAAGLAGTVAAIAAGLAGLLFIVHTARRLARWGFGTARRVGHLIDDLLGEPARDDQPARPGLMGQLAQIRERLTRVESRLTVVEAELRPNGGTSIKDQVTRIEQATGADRAN